MCCCNTETVSDAKTLVIMFVNISVAIIAKASYVLENAKTPASVSAEAGLISGCAEKVPTKLSIRRGHV